MKIGTVADTNDSTTTIATNDMVQEHVTNFTKELFGYIANGIGDDISSIARTMLGEVVEKIDDWQIERFQQSIRDDKISFTIQTNHSEKYSMLSDMRAHILRRDNNYQFIVTINSKNYGCYLDNTDINWCSIVYLLLNLQSKCNKKRSTHQLEYNFVSTQKPFPNDEYFLPTSYNKRARKDNDFTRTGQKTSRNCQSTGT